MPVTVPALSVLDPLERVALKRAEVAPDTAKDEAMIAIEKPTAPSSRFLETIARLQ